MLRNWKFICLTLLSIMLLAGCGKTLDEQAADGIAAAKEAFMLHDKNANDEVDGISLYKPAGFTIEDSSDAQNIVLKKGDETFILFVNPNEDRESRLFYDLLVAKEDTERFDEVFTDEGYFGFASVLEMGEDQVELITSAGGIKMTTITKKKNIENHMARMMEVVRSIEQES